MTSPLLLVQDECAGGHRPLHDVAAARTPLPAAQGGAPHPAHVDQGKGLWLIICIRQCAESRTTIKYSSLWLKTVYKLH